MRRWPPTAAAMPTRRPTTAQHGSTRLSMKPAQNLGSCSTFAYCPPQPITPSSCFLNLVSLVRFQPGAPVLTCTGRFRKAGRRPSSSQIAVGADNCRRARDYTRTQSVLATDRRRDYVSLCEPIRDRARATKATFCREIGCICGSHSRISAHIRRASFVSRFAALGGGQLREPLEGLRQWLQAALPLGEHQRRDQRRGLFL